MLRVLSIFLFLQGGCAEIFDIPPAPARMLKQNTKKNEEKPWPSERCDEMDFKSFSQNKAFSLQWRMCSRKTWGDSKNTVNCIRHLFPNLTPKCGSCFGAFTACGKDNCSKWLCWHDNPDCDRCGWRNCGAQLEKCLGFSRTTLYEYYH
ncbi:MAG: hypothetical protein KC505_02605 [Myxococcales bacterium]|nr:hypothetical protein [Myxococcales bacterium]USN51092.1 MAG: hypothetical protein H6731_01390 [Myxococcales bacterium]